jgi:hypothetical protein
MINFKKGAHWYKKDGTPKHDADLRIARKEMLLSSVTSIDKDMFPNYALERYKMDKLAEAAFNNPKQPHESVEDYAQRIYEDSLEHSSTAADFGTEFHDAMDKYGKQPISEKMQPYVDKFVEWQNANIIEELSSEKTIVDLDIGVAGRMDKRVRHKDYGVIKLDYKSQDVKKDKKGNKKPGFYESWVRQLSFYSMGEAKMDGLYPHQFDDCLSIVVDSNEPCEPFIHLWPREEVVSAYEDFVVAAYGYYKKRDYWPIGRWALCDKIANLPKL